MSNIAIIDAVFGDTGKGKITHYFAPQYDWCVRVAAANNCGHVVYRNGKKYNHHFLPSTNYLQPKTKSFLASGMLIHLATLLDEIKQAEQDFPGIAKTIYVDPDAFVITDEHIQIDREQNKHLGTTGKGVAPAAADKYAHRSPRIYNFINDNADIIKSFRELGVNFTPLLALREIFEKSNIIFEGHQGVLLDINAGITPYTTSSDCTVASIYAAGFNFVKLDKIYGLTKGGYLTKSGEGPLPTEIVGEEADRLRKLGNEIGNSTGRNRRIAYMDLPMLKYGVRKGGIKNLIMTKLDILNGQKSIKICYDYGIEIHSPNDFSKAKPFYIDVPGWEDASDVKQITPFIKMVENYVGIPVDYVSVGVNDEDIIDLTKVEKQETKPKETETTGFIKYGEEPSRTAPYDFDQACKNAGYPTLSELTSEIIKKRLVK
jgi:adenylosuccinate synthase